MMELLLSLVKILELKSIFICLLGMQCTFTALVTNYS